MKEYYAAAKDYISNYIKTYKQGREAQREKNEAA
jgi:hypothetical protein